MEPVWRDLDVLLISSRAEGLPMVALEALAHGIPVIANRVGALPDVLQHGRTGWLYDDNLDQAVRCLGDFLAARSRLGQGLATDCRSRVASEFSVDRGIERILSVYRQAGYLADNSAPTMSHEASTLTASISRRR
jgi:glycosyltransferase involved in cell wall biosynthesis